MHKVVSASISFPGEKSEVSISKPENFVSHKCKCTCTRGLTLSWSQKAKIERRQTRNQHGIPNLRPSPQPSPQKHVQDLITWLYLSLKKQDYYPLLLFEKKLHISTFIIITSLAWNPKSTITTTAMPVQTAQIVEICTEIISE